jgi:glycosyltransferase involved in cell wall biosynthesis
VTRPSVLHVLARPGGGGERYVRMLADGLSGFEHDSYLLTHRSRPIKWPPAEALARLPSLRREARGHELVHVHGAPALLLSLPVLGRRPTVLTTHGLNLLHSTAPRPQLAGLGLRRALSRGLWVIAVSTADRDALLAVAPGFSDSITVVHNGVAVDALPVTDRSATRDELGLADSSLALLFVGELADHKQPVQLAEAIQRARADGADVVGLLVGDGPLADSLEGGSRGAVRLLGERGDVGALLDATDIFVLPSLHEGMSLALLEAMARGRPVIVSDIPSNREAVGDAGIIVPVGDVAALSKAIGRLANDGGLRRTIGEAARRRAEKRFGLARMLDEVGSIYAMALGATG